jgi:hypothetical protein
MSSKWPKFVARQALGVTNVINSIGLSGGR